MKKSPGRLALPVNTTIFATQFQPEKSQKVGLQLLQNFVGLTKA